MNIFYVDRDPIIAAQSLCDKHVVKMILESAQMLCTAHHVNGGSCGDKIPYKATHVNHPSTKWVRENSSQYTWMTEHFEALCKEYTYRYDKIHKCEQYFKVLMWPPYIKLAYLNDPPQCMPEKYKCDDTVLSYRKYYKYGKAHILKYTKRERPTWLAASEI